MKVGTRNPIYKKWSTRTRRPLVNFETCIKCTQCWLQCPDECFEVTPEGTYEVVYEACIGCSICEDVCPVADCITMVNELEFDDNDSLYTMFKQDPEAYRGLLAEARIPAASRAESKRREKTAAGSRRRGPTLATRVGAAERRTGGIAVQTQPPAPARVELEAKKSCSSRAPRPSLTRCAWRIATSWRRIRSGPTTR